MSRIKHKLVTFKQYLRLTPRTQGYVVYMQAEREGSELKGCFNPYMRGTKAYDEWIAGAQVAMFEAQELNE